ncbi:HAMP domain-containing histidine kinase [Cytobacillus kochii]|uniref:sensor histidine kinase n=1 Tax=Cytobacillus kochii TaxID=859143 RepID=UPI001CD2CAF5|nr:HAMP domain-containing sensor histidine kinase [Cytobacillus kochii]MCA1024930.1 HAMP domain-containing histidine kinase [Cytobacillus kochii]MDM5206622.1 HAMP domain-containing sensor histidine kinase [Cytobacillus kochii]
MVITTHFFLNLSLLIVILFFLLVWTEKNLGFHFSKTSATISLALMIGICYIFSFEPEPGLMMDLRIIPVILGGLYVGVGPLLIIIVIAVRWFYGINLGFYVTMFEYLLLGCLFLYLYPRFKQISANKRIILAVLITFISSIVSLILYELYVPQLNSLDLWFALLTIPALGVGMAVYIIEFVFKTIDMQKKLIIAEKLEAVEQMGAAISHEIRNPLTAAAGFVQLLKEQTLSPSKRNEYLEIVQHELASAERVIQNYLTFSKPGLDKIETMNVKKELGHVISILRPIANQNSVEITTNFSIIGDIEGDRQKFQQCFLNVIKNAIESMPRGGQLYISSNYSSTHIRIEVQDTGLGMTEDQIRRLGEPYYSTKGAKGTGLGMMVVFSIARAMKGTIKVQSKINEGTVFIFTFPSVHPHSS